MQYPNILNSKFSWMYSSRDFLSPTWLVLLPTQRIKYFFWFLPILIRNAYFNYTIVRNKLKLSKKVHNIIK